MAALDFFDQARDELFDRMGFPRLERSPSAFSGGVQNQQERFDEQARRGGAPPTAGNLLGAGANALGIMGSGAVTTGVASFGELAGGLKPGTLGGFVNMEDHFSIPKGPYKNLAAWNKALRETRDRAARQAASRSKALSAGYSHVNREREYGGGGVGGGSGGGSGGGAPQGGQSGGPRGY